MNVSGYPDPVESGCQGALRSEERRAVVGQLMLQDEDLSIDAFVVPHVRYANRKIKLQEARGVWRRHDCVLEVPDA